MDKDSMSDLISFSRYQTKYVKFMFRQLMTSQTYLGSNSKAMADREKRGEVGNTKIWISWEWKKLFKWNKKHLSWFLKGYHLGEKQKFVTKKWTQVLRFQAILRIFLFWFLLSVQMFQCFNICFCFISWYSCIVSYAVGLKNCAITAGIKTYKSFIKKKRKKHDK